MNLSTTLLTSPLHDVVVIYAKNQCEKIFSVSFFKDYVHDKALKIPIFRRKTNGDFEGNVRST